MEYNDRYIAYANYHGKSPQEMIENDGGMHHYMRWVEKKKKEFISVNPDACCATRIKDGDAFTRFLQQGEDFGSGLRSGFLGD